MKLQLHADRVATDVVADVISHIVVKTVVDPLINTFLPLKKTETPAK